jgi:hypothetical protein
LPDVPAIPAQGDITMPRYVVERTFVDGLHIPVTEAGAATCQVVIDRNADVGVTLVHAYVSDDKGETSRVYDGPNPEAIPRAAEHNGLPADRIIWVSVLDPYFYQ